jgi:hypothetical protein
VPSATRKALSKTLGVAAAVIQSEILKFSTKLNSTFVANSWIVDQYEDRDSR